MATTAGELPWGPVEPGRHELWARAVDDLGNASESATNFVTAYVFAEGDLAIPTVTIASPTFGRYYTLGQMIPLSAEVDAGDGSVPRVEFLVNGLSVATNSGVSPRINWMPPALGPYVVVVRAHTAAGVVGESGPVGIQVVKNSPPTVSWLAPADGSTVSSGLETLLSAAASDADLGDSVTKVEFFVDDGLLGTAATSPYTARWSHPAVGSHRLYAKAYDANGASAQSAVSVVSVTAPEVALQLAFDGDASDSSPRRLATTVPGALAYGSGVFGQAVELRQGAHVAIDDGAALALGSEDFTVEAWIKPDSLPSDGRLCLFSQATPESGGLWIVMTGGRASLQWGALSPAACPLTTEDWHHVAAVRAGDNLLLYVDGYEVGSRPYLGALPVSSSPALVGIDRSGNAFSGALDRFVIVRGQAPLHGGNLSLQPSTAGCAHRPQRRPLLDRHPPAHRGRHRRGRHFRVGNPRRPGGSLARFGSLRNVRLAPPRRGQPRPAS